MMVGDLSGHCQCLTDWVGIAQVWMQLLLPLHLLEASLMYILFASRCPTSPSEGSLLFDCLDEGLQTNGKLLARSALKPMRGDGACGVGKGVV